MRAGVDHLRVTLIGQRSFELRAQARGNESRNLAIRGLIAGSIQQSVRDHLKLLMRDFGVEYPE